MCTGTVALGNAALATAVHLCSMRTAVLKEPLAETV
jgi:hypothetical protein